MREWLREARMNRGMTMKQVADALGCTESYYSLIERGERQKRMDMDLVMKLSEVFNIPVQKIADCETLI